MPNIRSAVKNLRKSERRRVQNLSVKSATKTQVKKYIHLINEGRVEEARALLPAVFKKVDMAVTKNVFHRNKAARIKSRLSRKLPVVSEPAPVQP
ncbi:MAG: 30S ribosomal protein S20 [Candidatus Atribacteria bacterium]|nr:30S ribosomal protein S20 [Candidatus Atribacteria bacterium]